MVISFPAGARVLSRETGKVLQQIPAGAYVDIKGGRPVHHEMTEAEWLARELSGAPRLSMTRMAVLRSAKQRLVDIATR